MTDITDEHRARIKALVDLSHAAATILQAGIGRFNLVLQAIEPTNPMAEKLTWQENVIDAFQAEYQCNLAQLRQIVGMFPEAIA